jgi:hypothetical protein
MNRTLKRPMFRIGGSAGTGITSGLDRTGYAGNKPTFKQFLDGLNKEQKQMQQENLFKEYQNFLKRQQVAEQKTMAADGGRIGYNQGSMPNFQMSGLPGFLTGFGLNLLATPPQGNIFQTAATAARDPFNQLQVSQARSREQQGERDFLRGERIAGDEAAMDRLKLKLESDERLKGMETNDALYNVMLEQYIEDDLPPQVAERAALFSTQNADTLRSAVTGTRYGGVLTFDIRDPNNQKQIRKNLDGKVVYDPFEDNYKYIVVRDGEVYFDEFNSIGEIKFPDLTATTEQKKIEVPEVFSPRVEDAQP